MTTSSTPTWKQVATLPMGERRAKPTALTADLSEAARELWQAAGTAVDLGVWEADAGTFTATRDGYDEICLVVSGSATIVDADGDEQHVTVGDLFVTPAGWTGTWTLHEPLRKVYVIVSK